MIELLPFEGAKDFVEKKIPEGKPWDSKDWSSMAPDVRARAFFSAKVENARFLNRTQASIQDFLARNVETVITDNGDETTKLKTGSRADFIRQTREMMINEGMLTSSELDLIKKEGDGDVKNLASKHRLGLIFDTNVRSAWGYGHWKQGMKPAILKRYPASRFIRNSGAKEPRQRHVASEGEIRLKTDLDYWAKYQNGNDIGGFEVPWAPFGYHSYMETEDVPREQAEALGLRLPETVTPPDKGLNDNLQAGTVTMNPKVKKALLDSLRDQIEPRPTRQNLAKQAAQKARIGAIERSLGKAKERGDTKEINRIQKVLDDERTKQGVTEKLKVVETSDAIKVVAPTYEPQKVESVKKLKERLLDAEGDFNKTYAPIKKEIEQSTKRIDDLKKVKPQLKVDNLFTEEALSKYESDFKSWHKDISSEIEKRKVSRLKHNLAGLDLIKLPEDQTGAVNVLGKRPVRGRKAEGLKAFEQVVHKDLSTGTSVRFATTRSDRSSQLDYGTHGLLKINAKAEPSVTAHEIMHQTEVRHLIDESREFLAMRAGEEELKSLNELAGEKGYGAKERGYEDNFKSKGSSIYAGKVYGRNARLADATELLTTGIERLLFDPIDFMRQDEQFFTWLVRTIQKRL